MKSISALIGLTPQTEDARLRHATALCKDTGTVDEGKANAYAIKRCPALKVQKSVVDAVKPISERYEIVQAGMMDMLAQRYNVEYHKQRTALIEQATAGSAEAIAKLRDGDAWSRQDFMEDREEKRHAYKVALRAIRLDAFDLIKPEIIRKSDTLLDLMDKMEAAERAEADAAGAAFVASGQLRAMARLARDLDNLLAGAFGQSPKQMMAAIGGEL